MVAADLATVQVFRFDPETDTAPHYDEFKVPYRGCSVLDVLRRIHEDLDSSLAFRWACTKRFCRGCPVSLNGQPVLACEKAAAAVMKIDPHPKFTLVKDLLVDLDRPKATGK